MRHDITQILWHTLASDLFFWNSTPYLVISYYYSKFLLVKKLDNIRSDTRIAHLKSIFVEHGIPAKLNKSLVMTLSSHVPYSKNSAKLMALLILLPAHNTNKTIAPLKELQTVKNLLQKNKESNADPHLATDVMPSKHPLCTTFHPSGDLKLKSISNQPFDSLQNQPVPISRWWHKKQASSQATATKVTL